MSARTLSHPTGTLFGSCSRLHRLGCASRPQPWRSTICHAAARWSRAQQEESIMSRLAIAFALALVATAANAQDATPGLSRAPAVGNPNVTQPFLFDGRMRGDGARQGAPADVHHPAAGVIV